MAMVKMVGPWTKTQLKFIALSNPIVITTAINRAVGKEAHRLRGIMIKGFNAQGPEGAKWKPLSPMTLKIRKAMGKRGSKALMRTGDLRKSINVVREESAWFVGVHRNAKSRDGTELVNIAEIHEFGTKKFNVRVTTQMRKFFLFLHIKSKGKRKRKSKKVGKNVIMPLPKSKTVLVIRIPKRPFIFPVWEKEQGESTRRIITDTLAALKLIS